MCAYYLIGEHLPHSFSADIHRAFGRYDYALKELAPEELGPFLERRAFAGLNVTIPYKEAVLPYLDRLDPQAAAIGAVNTVVNRDGTLWGYNTDFGGMTAAMRGNGIGITGKTVLVFGTGGTSKTALAVCRALGAAEVFRVSRTGRAGAMTYDQANALFGAAPAPHAPHETALTQNAPHETAPAPHAPHPSASQTPSPEGEGFGPSEQRGLVLINTTPAGMWPDLDACPMDLFPSQARHSERSEESVFPLSGVFDCVYNPLRTRLVLAARARGVPAAGGLFMLVKQAALACELFTGAPVADTRVDDIANALWRKQENIVLIGMPGVGKTTVGRLLAQKTGKKFVDSDEEVERRAGKPIAALFAEAGEPAFRDLEARVIRDLAGQTGLVVATGGGAVLRAENVRRLKQNGRLILLDRPLAALTPTPDRPLGDTPEKLASLYAARRPIYLAAADEIITADAPESAADAIAL